MNDIIKQFMVFLNLGLIVGLIFYFSGTKISVNISAIGVELSIGSTIEGRK